MESKDRFIQEGFEVFNNDEIENKLLAFLKENYPSVIKDNEIDLNELKAIAGLPIDEKVNGYGLNFVGRNFARGKYAQKTEMELRLNTQMSKNIDTTQNLVLKGDNLDSLKILKNHYTGKIKCIYIDPPYNTTNDEFIYPDRFNKEEAEVLGLVNLSEDDFARMDFSFKTKKSHNGWLSFMYPRLLLARDLLSKDGVIFISIDDNEQANLKLLCDDIFGEENLVANLAWANKEGGGSSDSSHFRIKHEYILCYSKRKDSITISGTEISNRNRYKDEDKHVEIRGPYYLQKLGMGSIQYSKSLDYPITTPDNTIIYPRDNNSGKKACWRWSETKLAWGIKNDFVVIKKDSKGIWTAYTKQYLNCDNEGNLIDRTQRPFGIIDNYSSTQASKLLDSFGLTNLFSYTKPYELICFLIDRILKNEKEDIVLDFFAGSGTTGHAVMELNRDGGNRRYILCQLDEPIDENKPAYQFCKDNDLPPVISSITIERLKRAGDKIVEEIEKENSEAGMFEEDKKELPDIGFKVFDSVNAPKLEVEDGQIIFPELNDDVLSRIYNMIFTVGLDEPTQVPEEVVKDCIYKIGKHYYITNSEKIKKEDYANAIKNGKVFIDGWTASLNGTLQHYKEDVKIVF
ncbi:MAG TPA: site-specific DNA-methyltransferase [Bacteroidaceae bacterium]|nr:site-specific DNA-methyltransferase [Bacteroidaceae bacterium]